MTGASGIVRVAMIGATTAALWLSPAAAGDQTMPGATVESVVAVARRLNPTVAAASLDFDAAVHKIGAAGVLADPEAATPARGCGRAETATAFTHAAIVVILQCSACFSSARH